MRPDGLSTTMVWSPSLIRPPQLYGLVSFPPLHKKTKCSYDFWWFPLGSGKFWKLAIDLTSCFTHQIYEFIHDLQGKRIVWHKQSIAGPKPFVASAQIIHEFINNHTGTRVFWRKSSTLIQKDEKQSSRHREYASSIYREKKHSY